MKIFTASTTELRFGDRLVPSFYYYTKVIREENQARGMESLILGEYSDISDGEHSHIPRNKKGGIRYLYGRNIKEGIIDFDGVSDDPYITELDYKCYLRCHIRQKDVLIAIYGTVGKSAVYREEYVGKAGIPRHIANITLKNSAPITPEYLTAYFRSKAGKRQMFSFMTGNIQQLLSLKNLRELEVPLAQKELIRQITENEKIAVEYEIEAQTLIRKAQEKLYEGLQFEPKEIKREFSFGVSFSELRESNLWSVNYYDRLYVKTAKRLEECNQAVPLGMIVNISRGDEVGSENYKEFIERNREDKPFIRTSDIVNWEVDLYPDYYVSADALEEVKQRVKAGDVIFTKDGKIGCVGLVTEADDMVLSSGIGILRLKEEALASGLTQEYLFAALSLPEIGGYGAVRRTVVASTIPHLREERLKALEIPLEEPERMREITALIRKAFQLKAARKTLLKENEQIFEGCFSQTGRDKEQ
ncbi:MAG: hypothetical protein HFI63_05010 [Lachnospiraceae bacterium]|nr:hypothetical protein [Lachnospiraceae bacterium]